LLVYVTNNRFDNEPYVARFGGVLVFFVLAWWRFNNILIFCKMSKTYDIFTIFMFLIYPIFFLLENPP